MVRYWAITLARTISRSKTSSRSWRSPSSRDSRERSMTRRATDCWAYGLTLVGSTGRWVAVASLLVPFVSAQSLASAAPSDQGIRFLEDRVKSDPDDFVAQNQLASRYLRKLRETGDYTSLAAARG